MRTKEEKSIAIERLLANKTNCQKTSALEEDSHLCIEAMIDVIKNDRSREWIFANYESDIDANFSQEQKRCEASLQARKYLDGHQELEELLYPEDPNKSNSKVLFKTGDKAIIKNHPENAMIGKIVVIEKVGYAKFQEGVGYENQGIYLVSLNGKNIGWAPEEDLSIHP